MGSFGNFAFCVTRGLGPVGHGDGRQNGARPGEAYLVKGEAE